MALPRLLQQVRDQFALHPRVPRATKAAIAAVVAWLTVLPLGGVADEYPYYAPLGAVIAVSTTVADSLRASLQGVAAILLGSGLVFLVGPATPGVVSLAIVVFVGTIVAGWWRLGEMGSWVPISALFVLIIGSTERLDYVIGYLGLTGLGAAVGIAVNAAFPPLPLTPGRHRIRAVRSALADQLEDLADALRRTEPLSRDDWLQRHHALRPAAREMMRIVEIATDARRVNWRARRWQDEADRQAEHAQSLERLSLVVDDLAELLADLENADRTRTALGPNLRGPAAEAMESVSVLLREDPGDSDEHVSVADAAVERFAEAVQDRMREGVTDVLAAGAVATALRQVVASVSAVSR